MTRSNKIGESLEPTIKRAWATDTDDVFSLVADLPPLTQHTWYTYWDLFSNFGNSCFIAREHQTDKAVGIVTTHPITTTPQLEWFGWQLGVRPEYRGTGLRERLQDHMVEAARQSGAVALVGTVEPDNAPSLRMYEQLAHKLGTELQKTEEVQTPSGIEVVYRMPLVEGA